MEKPDEKQPTTPTLPETQVPAVSSVVSADQVTASVRTERWDSGAAAGRPALLSLRNEIRVWTRDLLIAAARERFPDVFAAAPAAR